MLRNYARIALRTLIRHPGATLLNVLCLAIGITVCLLILLFVRHERSYDQFHDKADRTYRVLLRTDLGDQSRISTKTPESIASQLQEYIPEIETALRASLSGQDILAEANDKQFYENRILSADPNVFEVFSFEAIAGDLSTAFENSNAVVLTASTARKYFGDENPIGQLLTFEHVDANTVSAVIRDVPGNSHLDFDILSQRVPPPHTTWDQQIAVTYVVLREHADPATVEAKFPAFVDRYRVDRPGPVQPGYSLSLQPLTDIHLYPQGERPAGAFDPGSYLLTLGAAALLVLLIACITYIHHVTSRQMLRARELGVRKVLGAHRAQLARQLLGETFFVSLLALFAALLLTLFALPFFEHLVDVSFPASELFRPELIFYCVGIWLLVAVMSGIYPALYFSSIRPVQALRSGTSGGRPAGVLRKFFVVFQLTASTILLVSTLAIQRQLDYMRTTRLNQLDSQIVVLSNLGWFINENFDAFRTALLNHTGIVDASTGSVPGHIQHRWTIPEDMTPTTQTMPLAQLSGGRDYIHTLGLEIVAGEDFSDASVTPGPWKVIFNETAATMLGVADQVGESILGGSMELVGLVRDFHMLPLYDQIEPMAIVLEPQLRSYILVRLGEGNPAPGLTHIKDTWDAFVLDRPVLFNFLDEKLDAAYRSELRLVKIFRAFTLIAVLLAGIGLFGLSVFASEQRTREVGIRKILGASIPGIVFLLIKDFIWLTGIAFVIAVPISYFALNLWLDNFAYTMAIGPGLFLVVGVLTLSITLLTIGYHSVKTGLTNPVKSLRYE